MNFLFFNSFRGSPGNLFLARFIANTGRVSWFIATGKGGGNEDREKEEWLDILDTKQKKTKKFKGEKKCP